MEIKAGDKVRVSNKLPRVYERFGSWIAPHYECEVVEIEEGMALLDSIPDKHIFLFPLKYLTKVDAEEEKPKFKIGDRVCVIGSEILNGGVFTIIDLGFREHRGWAYELNIHVWYLESDLEPSTDPIRQMEAEFDEFRKAELDRVLHPGKSHTYEVTVDNVAMDRQRYEADLAKEIAVKLSNPNENKPGYVADYAVSVAKAVVENLKKK